MVNKGFSMILIKVFVLMFTLLSAGCGNFEESQEEWMKSSIALLNHDYGFSLTPEDRLSIGGRDDQPKFLATDASGEIWVIKLPSEKNPDNFADLEHRSYFQFEYETLKNIY